MTRAQFSIFNVYGTLGVFLIYMKALKYFLMYNTYFLEKIWVNLSESEEYQMPLHRRGWSVRDMFVYFIFIAEGVDGLT
jgi:hypothetical protein